MEANTTTDPEYDRIAVEHDGSARAVSTTQRGVVGDAVSKVACGFALAKLLHYISIVCACVTFIGGGILIALGTTQSIVELRYVAYAFGGATALIAVFFAFRSFSLALALQDLERLRKQMEDTVTNLRKVNEELVDTNKSLQDTNVSLQNTNASLRDTNSSLEATRDGFIETLSQLQGTNVDLGQQVASLTEMNERFRTAIGALVTAGSQSMDLTKMINDSLASIRQLESSLASERTKQEAFTTKLTASILAQMDANRDGLIDAIEQQKWLERLRV